MPSKVRVLPTLILFLNAFLRVLAPQMWCNRFAFDRRIVFGARLLVVLPTTRVLAPVPAVPARQSPRAKKTRRPVRRTNPPLLPSAKSKKAVKCALKGAHAATFEAVFEGIPLCVGASDVVQWIGF